MATIRLTVTAGDGGRPEDADPDALTDLMAMLQEHPTEGQRVTRLGGLSLPGAPASATPSDGRILLLELPDGDPGTNALRAIGGWSMRHPTAQLAVKADGPSGGVSMRLAGWSAVAFAAAVARILEQLADPDDEGPR